MAAAAPAYIPPPLRTEPVKIGADWQAWFVCRAKGITDDVMLPLKAGMMTTEAEAARQGRMRAARVFKRRHELHPCIKVEVEFQAIETPKDRL